MTSSSSSPVASWLLFAVASLAIVHALGETFGATGLAAGVFALAGAAIWLHWQTDPLRITPPAHDPGLRGRPPPPDDADGSAPVPSPVRPRPVLTGGAAKAIPSESR